ncbi:MAG: hypothetical protein JOY99_03985 [Sphingomonadaceae bacterium]|nr:hypothetical protein [Sphingomonadaceae bacterium]
MASKPETLQDDSEETGAQASAENGGIADKFRSQLGDLGSHATAKVSELRGQATDQVFSLAAQGKDRASETLDGAAKLIADTAQQIEERLGENFGGYARQASDAVGGLAATLRTKEVDELLDDAREFVKRSPALAVGAAAAAGFLIARVIKAGSTTLEGTAQALDPAKRDDRPKANGKAD